MKNKCKGVILKASQHRIQENKNGLEFCATVGIMRAWFYHYWECVKLRDCTQTKDL